MDFLASIRAISPTWEIILITFFFVAGFFGGIGMGKIRMIVILISIYIARVIASLLPEASSFISSRSPMELFALKSALFILLIFLVYILLIRSAFSRQLHHESRSGIWAAVAILTVVSVGHILTIIFQYLPKEELESLTPAVQFLFIKDELRTLWTILPIGSLFFIRGGKD